MPGLNRKGPNGQGFMTGRGMGKCNPINKGKTDEEILGQSMRQQSAENTNSSIGRFGNGRGRFCGGRGRRFGNID
jgi:hypothetical protein